MSSHYYIDAGGGKDGPHDLVTIMRRIRASKIGPDTLIYAGDADRSVAASEIRDIAIFFSREQVDASTAKAALPAVTLTGVLRDALRFTFDNNIMTVYAGAMLLLAVMLASGLVTGMGATLGGMLSWIVFVILHYMFFIFTLRIYRMQPFSIDFMNSQLAPVLPVLFFSAMVLAIMMIGGFMLLIIPAVLVAVYYAFVPFFIYDRRLSLLEAMVASRLVVQKHNRRYRRIIMLLVMMHAGALILIFPIPVTMPMFAASLARIYEELSIT
jgi:hypothetical protein